MRLMGLMLAGPKSRAVLAALTDHDVSNAAFRFMDHRAIDVGGVPARVNRISYTGDLGYEIWVEPCYLRSLYRAVQAAGAPHGLADFGMRALLSMRLEKNWPTWFAELRPIYGAFEGGMERFVKLSKDFIGRDAAAREAEAGPRLRRVSLVIEAEDADVMGDEPVWARVEGDYGAVAAGHGVGAARFDAAGAEIRRATRGATATGGWSAGSPRAGTGTRSRCRSRRAICRPRWPSARRRGSSRSRSSACGGRRASWSTAVRSGRQPDAGVTAAARPGRELLRVDSHMAGVANARGRHGVCTIHMLDRDEARRSRSEFRTCPARRALSLVDGAGQGADLARKAAEGGPGRRLHIPCTFHAHSMHLIAREPASAGGPPCGTIPAVDGRNERDAGCPRNSNHG